MHNLFDEALIDGSIYKNPYSIYASLRSSNPIFWSEIKKAWIVLNYRDIEKGLSTWPLTVRRKSIQNKNLKEEDIEIFSDFFDNWLMYQENEAHDKVKLEGKKLIGKKEIDTICDYAKYISLNLLKSNASAQRLDIIKDYGIPIAISSLCNLYKIPTKHYLEIEQWSNAIVNFMQGRYNEAEFEIATYKAKDGIIKIRSFLEKHYDLYRIYFDTSLDKKEFISLAENIIIDGYEPIVNAIANSVLSLFGSQPELEKILTRKKVSTENVLELLRYDPPFQYVVREVKTSFIYDEIEFNPKERVLFIIASGNRDPKIYKNPDTLDIDFNQKLNLSFGYREHFCLGFNLAIEIVRLSVENLFANTPEFRINYDSLIRYENLGSRAISKCEVYWS